MPSQSTGTCDYCHQPSDDLIRRRRQDYGKWMCRPCFADFMRWWRRSPERRAINRRIGSERYAARREVFHRLKEKPCSDCGGTFPHYVMEFDHPDRSVKTGTISTMLSASGYELTPKILDEIAKCALVCANCHRIRTRQQWERGEWKGGRNRLPEVPTWTGPGCLEAAKNADLGQSA